MCPITWCHVRSNDLRHLIDSCLIYDFIDPGSYLRAYRPGSTWDPCLSVFWVLLDSYIYELVSPVDPQNQSSLSLRAKSSLESDPLLLHPPCSPASPGVTVV
jgi:hypothetical protein